MTERPFLPPPDSSPEAAVAAPPQPRRNLLPWLYALGLLVLALAIVYVWQYPNIPSTPPSDVSAVQAAEQRLADVDSRLNRLEQRPTVDLSKISARIDALEGRIADQTQLAARVDTLSGRIEALSGRSQTGIDTTKQQIDGLTTRLAALEANAGNLVAVTKRLNRIARLQEASLALASGRPIGDLPGAPDALARYAHAAPPTEADLRLRFPQAEQAALAANQAIESNTPFVGRVWERAQGLITVRRGGDVVVGNPAAVILTRAQMALDAGDLAGAVGIVETLKGEPEQAMAGWLADARALVDARSAFANMAAQA